MNRMCVYDAAPRAVRAQAKRHGEGPLQKWFLSLDYEQQTAVLEGRPIPPSPKDEWSVFQMLLRK
jgi:hypothetical protein